MGDCIQIKYGSLKDAVHALSVLESSLKKREFSTISLINESRGDTYEAVNQCYENMRALEENLSNLVTNIKKVLDQCGIQFAEAENESIKLVNSITEDLKDGKAGNDNEG